MASMGSAHVALGAFGNPWALWENRLGSPGVPLGSSWVRVPVGTPGSLVFPWGPQGMRGMGTCVWNCGSVTPLLVPTWTDNSDVHAHG